MRHTSSKDNYNSDISGRYGFDSQLYARHNNCGSANELAQKIALVKELQGDNRPFVVMDTGRVSAALDVWQRHLPDVEPYFAIQCNSDAVLLEQLASHPTVEVSFSCTTRLDVRRALELVAPRRVLCANPFLTNSSLSEARALDVNLVAFESLADLKRISLNHADAELILNLGLNALSSEGDEDCEMEEAVVERAEQLLQAAADLECRCVGLALGSFVAEESVQGTVFAYSRALAICRRLFEFGRKVGSPLRLIHMGDMDGDDGGRGRDFANSAGEIRLSLDAFFPREEFPLLRVIATPSRAFCSGAFSLVTRVTGQRLVEASVFTNDEFDDGSHVCTYEVNDEGCFGVFALANDNPLDGRCQPLFNHSGSFGADYTSEYAAVIGASFDYHTAGLLQPLCKLPTPPSGQSWLVWADVGAYSFNDGESLEVECGDPPQVFYFAAEAEDEWRHFQKSTPEERLAEVMCCQSAANDSDGGYEGGRDGGSLVSDACSLEDNMEEGNEWALDWLHNNEFGY